MTAPTISPPSPFLTKEEWNEIKALKEAITYNPATVIPEQQERFVQLFSRSLIGKGDGTIKPA